MNRFILNVINIIIVLTFLLTSCNTKKKYFYKQDNKDETIIEEYSDSSAYMTAFQNFEISKKVYNDMKKSLGTTTLESPTSFELLNDKHENITYRISFLNKDSLENACAKSINQLSNNIEKSVTKSREERNGIGAKYDTAGLYKATACTLIRTSTWSR